MFSSVPLLSVFTVLFLVTAVYSVVHLAALPSGASSCVGHSVDRAAELSHVLMSVAMIAMMWGWSGGPSSPSGALQIVAFGLIAIYFLTGAVRGHRAPAAGAYHLLMALAMVWMIATMPLLTGSGAASGMDMEDMPWMSSSESGPTGPVGPGEYPWVLPLSLVFAALLVAATLLWAYRAVKRSDGRSAHCAPTEHCAPVEIETGGGVVAVVTAPAPRTSLGTLLAPRTDAVCRTLMSAGMAGMLAAML